MQRRGHPAAADAAITFATLCFGAGIALVGQMYHLPGDWPAGAMLIAIGGLVAAALTGKSGPLVIAFVAMTSWSWGRFDGSFCRDVHWSFLLLFVPGFLLALGRENRLLAHAAMLALSVWLAALLMPQGGARAFFNLVDGGLAVSAAYMAIGLLALDRGWPAIIKALLPWGAVFFGILLCVEIGLVLEKSLFGDRHDATAAIVPAYAAALAALAALAMLARERDSGRLVIIAACAVGLTIPLMFFGMAEAGVLRRALVSIAVFVSAVGLIAGGLLLGLRTFIVVGYAVFGVSIFILLWQTIGTLLSQSLFFLVAGVALAGSGGGCAQTGKLVQARHRNIARESGLMPVLDTLIARVPLLLRYVLAALVLCGLILVIVVQRAGILRSGQEVRLETAPVDPRDLFRGDYVVLDYRIGTVNVPSNVTTSFKRGQRVFVTLRPDQNNKAKAVAISAEQPAATGNDIVIAGFVTATSTCALNDAGARDCKLGSNAVGVRYGLETYFVPEGEGKKIEVMARARVEVVAAVAPSGQSAIKRLLIDGVPVYDEPPY